MQLLEATPAVSGALSAPARMAYVAKAIAARLGALVPARRHPPLERAALRELPHPQGALARHADAIAEGILPPWLAAHSSRTYAWGALLGLRDGISFDADLLYAAAMLHDLGLSARCAPPQGACFAVWGGRAAADRLRELGIDDETAGRVARAIALHLEVSVSLRHGPEAHLLSRGAGLDVIGRDAPALERALRDDVVARWPRDACKANLREVLRAQAQSSPRSRTALLLKLGFLRMISHAPFSE